MNLFRVPKEIMELPLDAKHLTVIENAMIAAEQKHAKSIRGRYCPLESPPLARPINTLKDFFDGANATTKVLKKLLAVDYQAYGKLLERKNRAYHPDFGDRTPWRVASAISRIESEIDSLKRCLRASKEARKNVEEHFKQPSVVKSLWLQHEIKAKLPLRVRANDAIKREAARFR